MSHDYLIVKIACFSKRITEVKICGEVPFFLWCCSAVWLSGSRIDKEVTGSVDYGSLGSLNRGHGIT